MKGWLLVVFGWKINFPSASASNPQSSIPPPPPPVQHFVVHLQSGIGGPVLPGILCADDRLLLPDQLMAIPRFPLLFHGHHPVRHMLRVRVDIGPSGL